MNGWVAGVIIILSNGLYSLLILQRLQRIEFLIRSAVMGEPK